MSAISDGTRLNDDHMPALAAEILQSLRDSGPLVHNITNFVTMNFIANALLASGASPVMAHALEEVGDMTGLADALCLNIGTLTPDWVDAMEAAASAAVRKGIPVALDPVGAGATIFRTKQARRIIFSSPQPVPDISSGPSVSSKPGGSAITVIRGNASEILSLMSNTGEGANSTRGVDSIHGVDKAVETAVTAARRLGCLIAVTGAEDCVTDGVRILRIANGHPLMPRITGTGCVATALIAAFLTAGRRLASVLGHDIESASVQSGSEHFTAGSPGSADDLAAVAAALSFIGLAGEKAASQAAGPGSFIPLFLDALYAMTPDELTAGARIRREEIGPDEISPETSPRGTRKAAL